MLSVNHQKTAAIIVTIVDLACIEEWRNRGDKCMRENIIFDQMLPSYMTLPVSSVKKRGRVYFRELNYCTLNGPLRILAVL